MRSSHSPVVCLHQSCNLCSFIVCFLVVHLATISSSFPDLQLCGWGYVHAANFCWSCCKLSDLPWCSSLALVVLLCWKPRTLALQVHLWHFGTFMHTSCPCQFKTVLPMLVWCSFGSTGHSRKTSEKIPRSTSTSLWEIWAMRSMTEHCLRRLSTVVIAQMQKSSGIMPLAGNTSCSLLVTYIHT